MSGLCVRAGGDVDPSAGLSDGNITENHSFIAGTNKTETKHENTNWNTQAGSEGTTRHWVEDNTGLIYTGW